MNYEVRPAALPFGRRAGLDSVEVLGMLAGCIALKSVPPLLLGVTLIELAAAAAAACSVPRTASFHLEHTA